MLWKDVHLLFDRGFICIDPQHLTIDVHPSIRSFPSYVGLHGSPLKVHEINSKQREWIAAHWLQHRNM